ncbi:HNH endonuclease domain-containing protein [uncultured Shewanella sp.]|uniref:HNH endonuclease domain-containing protein n=1 Tax=uncultured Shewanella sp. TaxID=173975 RepID=UPI00263190D9|nr:HNH endonuclease domain-containing protein [uncultured Shewanella sp.]
MAGSILQSSNNWDLDVQKKLSEYKAPDYLMGPRGSLLQGDISREWFKWIVDQFVDKSFLNNTIHYYQVYSDVLLSVEHLVGNQKDDDDKKNIAKLISDVVFERIKFLNSEERRRKIISLSLKEDLLSIYGPKPRCWLTGLEFSSDALFNFTAKKIDKVSLKLPVYVDKYRPIGVNDRDLSIEIDHLYPFSYGGKDELDNYRLICGWANKVKSNHVTGYSTGTRVSGANKLYPNSFYYWVVRTIGLKRKCEVANCQRTIDNSELTVCSQLGNSKAITPVSMKVVCKKHDTRKNRYVPRNLSKEPFHI